jgi:hypothetical protein
LSADKRKNLHLNETISIASPHREVFTIQSFTARHDRIGKVPHSFAIKKCPATTKHFTLAGNCVCPLHTGIELTCQVPNRGFQDKIFLNGSTSTPYASLTVPGRKRDNICNQPFPSLMSIPQDVKLGGCIFAFPPNQTNAANSTGGPPYFCQLCKHVFGPYRPAAASVAYGLACVEKQNMDY